MNSMHTQESAALNRGTVARRGLLRGMLTAGVGGTLLATPAGAAAWAQTGAAGSRRGITRRLM